MKDDIDITFFIELVKKQKQGVVIDAGANVGYTSVIFAKAFPSSSIISYEPVRLLSQIIYRVVRFFRVNNIEVRQKALGDSLETVMIKTPVIQGVKKQGLSYIDKEVDREDIELIKSSIAEEVDMVTLDSDWGNHINPPISGIKVDVENFEYFVLKGARNLVMKFRPIVMAELWDNARRNSCIQLMQELGYKTFVIKNKELVKYQGQSSLNYFFIPDSTEAE
ncbi:FkbM family methyltransferase [Sediminibacterium salmoneum]|uniref:FkbM family methyltransferase n=1 Tax=Sediminibacterium salmoneum TaxID=426421 RepID=UPI0004B8E78A|nr:FkbM family methyltransferase [Sediminibacterium salmoneum]